MSSLSTGFAKKFGRITKIWTVINGARLDIAAGGQIKVIGDINIESAGDIVVKSGGTQTVNASGRFLFVPQALPGTCTVGEVTVNSTGNKLAICTASNTWTTVGTQV